MSAAAQELTILGIETSCDETAASVVRGFPPGPGTILSNVVLSQTDAHRPYGGVVPEIAARAHIEWLDGIVAKALGEAKASFAALDAVAATAGPGLIGGIMVGLLTGKALALAAGKPFIAVNHLEAHALSARLALGCPFPFLLLLISGGHCQLMTAEGVGRYRLYGATIDDAAGEAYDKTAKLLGLPYPGGPQIERLAKEGNAHRFTFPRPLAGRPGADFSFSGLKTAVHQALTRLEAGGDVSYQDRADIAASFQAAVLDVLQDRVGAAMQQFRATHGSSGPLRLVVAGGVAANQAVRLVLESLAEIEGFAVMVPPASLCTDNGAMIAWAGLERLAGAALDDLSAPARARWPLELTP